VNPAAADDDRERAPFLAEVQANGLITERERHTYAFAHHTFGEYLTARHIRDNGLQQVLIDSVNDPWWRETTLLYVTDADADDVVEACLDRATIASLALAFECVQVGGDLAPNLRERLNQILAEATNASDPERRRLAAGVLATRQLSGQVTTTTGSRVCPRPISTDLYLLPQPVSRCWPSPTSSHSTLPAVTTSH